jgi:Uncharacterized protein conserved in bacteria
MSMTECLSETADAPMLYPGQQLAQAREARGLSQTDVATRLYLRVQVIDLLETDDYDRLPQFVFVQGYLRAYAKLLGLDPEPLLSQYAALKNQIRNNKNVFYVNEHESLCIEKPPCVY